MNKQFNSVLRLRRDNDYNYAKIADTFIPANGEICLVDTAADGLRAVCGDGKSTFGKLKFIGDVLEHAYLKDGVFYEDSKFEIAMRGSTTKIYLDYLTYSLYLFDGNEYKAVSSNDLPSASSQTAGIMKLYSATGQNTDGTMTQKAISDELNDKIEMVVHPEEEMLVLDYDLI